MTRSIKGTLLAVLAGAVLLTGCTINRDIMFKTPNDHVFDTLADTTSNRVKVQPNDVIQFRLFANDGFKMIDLISEGGRDNTLMSRTFFSYYVEFDGTVKLPLVGRIPIIGYTLREAEAMLEERYSQFYNHPFVQLNITNRRVVVFPGGGGDAKVVSLEQNNTTLLEVLAQAGGLNKRGDAHRVKVFRLDPSSGKRKVFQFDMSDISGLKYADMVMQGDDVVYVQPNAQIATEALQDLVPVITLMTTILLAISIFRNFQ